MIIHLTSVKVEHIYHKPTEATLNPLTLRNQTNLDFARHHLASLVGAMRTQIDNFSRKCPMAWIKDDQGMSPAVGR